MSRKVVATKTEQTLLDNLKDVVDEFGLIKTNVVDVNEVTQYALLKALLFSNTEERKDLLPQQARNIELGQFFPFISFIDSSKETNAEYTNELTNYLLSSKYQEELLQINNKDISSLLAEVQFIRVPKKGKVLDYKNATIIPFSTHYSKNALETIFQEDKNTSAAGLKSLNIQVISDTGAFYKYKIKMDLFFANPKVLHNNKAYSALLQTPTSDPNLQPVVYLLIFGWARPSSPELASNPKLKALSDAKNYLLLSLINYELSISPDGTIGLSINFFGAAEEEADSFKSNTLIPAYMYDNNQEAGFKQTLESLLDKRERVIKAIKDKQAFTQKWLAEQNIKERRELEESGSEPDPSKEPNYNEKFANFDPNGDISDDFVQDSEKNAKLDIDTWTENGVPPSQLELEEKSDSFNVLLLNKLNQDIAKYKVNMQNANYEGFLLQFFKFKKVYSATLNFDCIPLADNSGIAETKINFIPSAVNRPLFEVNSPNGAKKITGFDQEGLAFKPWSEIGGLIKRAQQISDSQEGIIQAEQELVDAFFDARDFYDEIDDYRKYYGKEEFTYGQIFFTYMFVGDIIAMAYLNASSNNLYENKDNWSPLNMFSVLLGTLDLSLNDERTLLDLAFVPIPTNLFMSWFYKKVVKTEKQIYSFNDFTKDFMNDCVLTAVNNYEQWAIKYEGKFTRGKNLEKTPLSYKSVKTFHDDNIELVFADLPFNVNQLGKSAGSLTDEGFTITSDFTQKYGIKPSLIKQKFLNNEISANPKNAETFIQLYKTAIVYGRTGFVKRSGDYKENLFNGIFHFFVGASTGILREIKFNPLRIPSLKDAQIIDAVSDRKGSPFNDKFSVTQRYDVNISCFGFHYFKPGQIIFVDTSLLGFGDSADEDSFSHIYNLGGYYVVTDVSHSIDGNDFSTSITAKFIGYPEKKATK